MTETSDPVVAPPDDEAVEPGETDSVTELVVQLGREVSVLVFCEAQLAASRNMPEARRAVRDIAAALVAAVAFLTAFVFANVAAMLGLTSVLSSWLAAVVLHRSLRLRDSTWPSPCWFGPDVTGWRWWRMFSGGAEGSSGPGTRPGRGREAVRETLERLAPAITVEIAAAAVPMATDAVGGVVDVGGDVIEASDDLVEALAEDLPGGGVVNQMWDVVLMPGRFGVKVATTVLKRGEPEG